PVAELVADLIRFLSQEQETAVTLPEALPEKISRLMHYLQSQRCLLVLDNLETILQGGEYSGYYRDEHRGYGELFRRVAEIPHQSCLVITSRENLRALAPFEGEALPVRSLALRGLTETDVRHILQVKGSFTGTPAAWQTLTDRYAGNPLALKIVATTIQELFDGDISEFLQEGATVFDDLRALLDQHFDRLSPLEQTVMYWLAIAREAITVNELQADLATPTSRSQLLDALSSLRRRSLLEKLANRYTQQPVVMEYITERLIHHVTTDLETEEPDLSSSLFHSHALIKAPVKDYIRDSQIRLILTPIADRLLLTFRSRPALIEHLKQVLLTLQTMADVPGYGAGNLLNVFRHLETDLTGYDFSNLTIWYAYLQDVNLPRVNFAHADLTKSVFAQTLGSILSVAFSPDGQHLATSDADGEIRLWRVADGTQRLAMREALNWVWSVVFSPDSQTIASSGEDPIIRLWEVQTGDCIQELEGHTNWVWSVAFSPDGQYLASGSEDQTIRLWEVQTGECTAILQGHTGGVCTIAFCPISPNQPTSGILASASDDKTIRLWNLDTLECTQILEGHTERIRSIAISPDAEWLASAGDDQTVRLWELATGNCTQTLPVGSRVWSVAFSSLQAEIEPLLVTGDEAQRVKVWQIASGHCLHTFEGHRSRVWTAAFSPDAQVIASGSDDQTIRLWETQTGRCIRTFQGYNNWIWAVSYGHSGFASGSEDGMVRLWDAQTGACTQTLKGHSGRIWTIAFQPRQNDTAEILASGSDDRTIKLWNLSTGRCIKTLRGHAGEVRVIAFHPDGSLLASNSGGHTVKLWNVETGQSVRTLRDHEKRVFSIAFSPDGQYLATGSEDQTIRLWEVQTGTCLRVLEGHRFVLSVAFSPVHSPASQSTSYPGSFILASGSDDQTIRLWQLTGECLHILKGHTGWIQSIAFSPDGSLLASGSTDQTVKLWQVETGTCLHTFQGHHKWVQSVSFSPDGKQLVSGSEDETLKIWDVRSGECLHTLRAERPYEGMNIFGVTGVTEAQKATLRALGAIEVDESDWGAWIK
ncbi:hypothetical protein C7B76_26110, partial [filamentous cyanobacterium CCP2]